MKNFMSGQDPAYWYAYFQDDGHFIPQYDYVFDENGHRLVQHVVHMEKFVHAIATTTPTLSLWTS
jgi:hypothetical protein